MCARLRLKHTCGSRLEITATNTADGRHLLTSMRAAAALTSEGDGLETNKNDWGVKRIDGTAM